jgi:hypothetical protein
LKGRPPEDEAGATTNTPLHSIEDHTEPYKSLDSSVGIALGYGLDDRGTRVRLPAGPGNFSLTTASRTALGVHPASYPTGTRGFFSGGKAAGA